MLRSGRGSFWKGARRAATGAYRARRVLCGALHVQCGRDGAVPSQPAAAALPASYGVQQRRQHHSNGSARQVAVRRDHWAPLAAGGGLHPAGPYPGHGGGTAGVSRGAGWRSGTAPTTAAAAGAAAAASTTGAPPGDDAEHRRCSSSGHRSVAAVTGTVTGTGTAAAGGGGGGGAPVALQGGPGCRGAAAAAAAPAPAAGAATWPYEPGQRSARTSQDWRARAAGGYLGPWGSYPGRSRCGGVAGASGQWLAARALGDGSGVPAAAAAVLYDGDAPLPGGSAAAGLGVFSPSAPSSPPPASEAAASPQPSPSPSTSASPPPAAVQAPVAALPLQCSVPTATAVSPPATAAASSSPRLSPPTAAAAAAAAAVAAASPLQVPASLPSASAVASTPAAPTAPGVIIPSLEDRSNGLGRLGRLSYRLILAYDGTEYCGWQLQPSAPTVQRTLEGALCTVLREERAVLGVRAAGRTDSGVHARGQVVQFSCNRELDVAKMPYKLNSVLPHDIRVLRLTRTAPDFSVTCSALGKCYHYSLTNAEAHDPLRHRYCLHVRRPLDLAAMRTAAAALEGTHDFTQFSNIGEEAGRPRRRNPVKTLRRVEVVELGGESTPGGIRIEVEGNGFLYKMVRHISGALVAVGEGRLPVATIGQMLEVGNNAPPGCHGTYRGYNVAPAKGLCLHQVFYDPGVDDPSVLLYPELRHDEYGRLLESIPDARSDED